MGFSNVGAFAGTDIVDSVSEFIFGIPCTSGAMDDNFLDSINTSDIRLTDKTEGFVKNKAVIIFNPQTNTVKRYSTLARNGLTAIGWCAPVDLYVVSCFAESTGDVVALCKKLEQDENILLAQPLTVTKTSVTYTSNDPFDGSVVWNEIAPAGSNWWLEAIDARQAWDYNSYFNSVKLGVVDCGFQLDHPDLAGKISFPDKKQQNRNRPDSHGTHVAGIIAAKANNSEGIIGVCPKAKLVCVDWEPENDQTWITTFAIVYGLVQSVKAGAKAVNFSVGMSASVPEGGNELGSFAYYGSAALCSYSIASLLNKGYEFVAVHSAGNGNEAEQVIDARNSGYFAAINEDTCFTGLYRYSFDDILDHVIVVGAARNMGNRQYMQSSYSNSGPEVSITAPGNYIYSCYADSAYDYMSGTSMATPVVTGVAGLLWSINPELTGAEVKEIICTCTDRVAVKSDSADYLGESGLRDIALVNADLCVREALLRKNSNMGTVTGKLPDFKGGNATAEFGGKTYTVKSDGSFAFVAEQGTGNLTVTLPDGTVIFQSEITVTKGTETIVDTVVKEDEEPAEETEEETDEDITETVNS